MSDLELTSLHQGLVHQVPQPHTRPRHRRLQPPVYRGGVPRQAEISRLCSHWFLHYCVLISRELHCDEIFS